ncbi:MAG: peptidoglycan-binding domain-containing protein, partial [Gammaproteobacteria bacterium]|nr:peptidoglycan-binding domain-containing protein [Gammaproteobacteria bacterium]
DAAEATNAPALGPAPAGDTLAAPVEVAPVTVPAPAPSLGQLIAALEDDGAASATRRLLALWDVASTADDSDLCAAAERAGLRCLEKFGSWRALLDYDLPAVLTLSHASGGNAEALLLALSAERATLAIGDHEQAFSLDEIDAYWTGGYVLLWRPPLDGVTVIRPGRTGHAARWLWQTMARIDGEPIEGHDVNTVGDALVQRVKTFQRSKGLTVDGIAGPETLLHLGATQPGPARPSLGRPAPEPPPAMTRESRVTRSES